MPRLNPDNIELAKEIGDWAYYSGVRRLFLVNTHVTNAAPLRCALEMLRAEHDDLMVALFNSGTISARGFKSVKYRSNSSAE